jgi:phosphatidate cytidylyltransferase
VADDEGRERRGEDLFEDLDKFFAPIQDVDWPEEGSEPGAPEAESGQAEPGVAAGEAPEPGAGAGARGEPDVFDTQLEAEEGGFRAAAAPEFDEEAPGIAGDAPAEPPAGSELLPDDWAAGIADDGIDLDLDVPPAVPEGSAPGRYLGEPTQEMSVEEWAELRIGGTGEDLPEAEPASEQREPFSYMEQFLPDEGQPEVPEFGYGPEPGTGAPPAGGTTGIDWDESAAASGGPSELEDSGPITIDDLRRPPDVYRDLPGPDAPSSGQVPGFDEDEEPQEGDVEAAAEHFAESIREEEPELGLAPAAAADAEPFAAGGEPLAGGADLLAAGDAAPVVEPGDDLFGPADVREPYSDRPEPLIFPDEGEGESDELLSFGEPTGPRTVKVGGTEETGPSWQEPTSVEVPVEGEHEPPRPGRNIPAAIVTGIALAVVAAVALLLGKPFFGFVAGAIVLLAQLELYTALRRAGHQPAVPLGLAVGGLVCAAGYLKGEGGILAMTAIGALFIPLWYMATPARHRRNVVVNIGMTMFGILAVPFLAGYALVIIHSYSRAFTIAVLGLAFGFDIAAYAIGTFSGNRPLAPTISPNKTREGAIGAFGVMFVVFGLLVLPSLKPPISSVWVAIGLTIAASLAAVFGDLAESLVKRDLGVKDMGTIFPGHGGALDRIDSILFVAPVVYYFLRIFG